MLMTRRVGLALLLSGFVALGAAGPAPVVAGEFPKLDALPSQTQPPDPLKMFDGTPVTTAEQWFSARRPEIKALFEHYMYGAAPPPPEVSATIERSNDTLFGGKATLQEVTLRFGPPAAPPVHLLLVIPNQRQGPIPAFVGLNFCGNHAVLDDPEIRIPSGWMYKHCPGCENARATASGRGGEKDVWCAETLVNRGYALATFYDGDIDPDLADFTDGIHPHYLPAGSQAPGPHDWGTIAAWAWGLQRAVDYLLTREEIHPEKIAAIGHSRLGKTALLAGAFDERIAIVVPHQSGTGGCALSRDNDQETVERINRSFPHWFNDAFVEFGGHEDRLPIDQHLLMALVAPRPLLDTEGLQDKWANYDNAYRALQAADAVYKFLGAKGLVDGGRVEADESIEGPKFGALMQYRRDTRHVLNQDYWNKILDFADRHYAGPRPERVK